MLRVLLQCRRRQNRRQEGLVYLRRRQRGRTQLWRHYSARHEVRQDTVALVEAVSETEPFDKLPARQAKMVRAADDQPGDRENIFSKTGLECGHGVPLSVLVPEEIAAMLDPLIRRFSGCSRGASCPIKSRGAEPIDSKLLEHSTIDDFYEKK